jgi:hypothetical protein
MNVISVVSVIKQKFAETGSPTQIPLQAGKTFQAELVKDGVKVSNLGDQPFLHWAVFQEAVCVLIQNGGSTKRGDAMRAKLGESELPLNSVEGHIAQVVYGKQAGDTVFRRIAPIAAILVWAGICDSAPGRLILRRQD